MEEKKVLKKLSLNKETVSRLNSEEMNQIKGGFLSIIGSVCNCASNCKSNGDQRCCGEQSYVPSTTSYANCYESQCC